MLAQRIFSLALGYEDLNDQQTLRDDPALQLAAGKVADPEQPLASPSTLCRLDKSLCGDPGESRSGKRPPSPT